MGLSFAIASKSLVNDVTVSPDAELAVLVDAELTEDTEPRTPTGEGKTC